MADPYVLVTRRADGATTAHRRGRDRRHAGCGVRVTDPAPTTADQLAAAIARPDVSLCGLCDRADPFPDGVRGDTPHRPARRVARRGGRRTRG